MSKIDQTRDRNFFFPKKKGGPSTNLSNEIIDPSSIVDPSRKEKLDKISKTDAKVTIPEGVRDFSKIKKAVDNADNIDNSEKISFLKDQIKNGQYKVDVDALADQILEQEF